MTSFIVREMLSKSLYELFKNGESRFLIQVPFVDKNGEPLPDEDCEHINIVKATKELLEAGASPLYYVRDVESFLLPNIIQSVESGSGFSDETKSEVIKLLIENISENELRGLLPEHSNMLLKQMLYHENELNNLIAKGLTFKQDIDNRYGEKAIEIKALLNGNNTFFLKIAEHSMNLDFDLVYQENQTNETTLKKEIEKLKVKLNNLPTDNEKQEWYENQKIEGQKTTIEFLEKWILKKKIESKEGNSNQSKNQKFKI